MNIPHEDIIQEKIQEVFPGMQLHPVHEAKDPMWWGPICYSIGLCILYEDGVSTDSSTASNSFNSFNFDLNPWLCFQVAEEALLGKTHAEYRVKVEDFDPQVLSAWLWAEAYGLVKKQVQAICEATGLDFGTLWPMTLKNERGERGFTLQSPTLMEQVDWGQGVGLLTGDVGSGKSTLAIHMAMEFAHLNPNKKVWIISNSARSTMMRAKLYPTQAPKMVIGKPNPQIFTEEDALKFTDLHSTKDCYLVVLDLPIKWTKVVSTWAHLSGIRVLCTLQSSKYGRISPESQMMAEAILNIQRPSVNLTKHRSLSTPQQLSIPVMP